MSTAQSCGGMFLIEAPSFQMALACVKLIKNQPVQVQWSFNLYNSVLQLQMKHCVISNTVLVAKGCFKCTEDFVLHIKFRIFFFSFCKEWHWDLIYRLLFGSVSIFPSTNSCLILPTYEVLCEWMPRNYYGQALFQISIILLYTRI